MKKREGIACLAVLVISLALCSSVQAITYHVSTSGSDNNTGTEILPWKTMQHAADSVTAGDTVFVKEGIYDERVYLKHSGNETNKIIFEGESRKTEVLHGFDTKGQRYLTIQGFNITHNKGGWLGGGIWLYGSNIDIIDNYFHDIPGQAISPNWGNTSNNIYVYKNKIYKCNKGIVASGNNWLVEENEVDQLFRADSINPWAYGEDADYSRFFGENITFRKNYFHGAQSNEITFLVLNLSNQTVSCLNFSDCNGTSASHCGYDYYCRGNSHVDGFQTFGINGNIAKNVVIEDNIVESFSQGAMLSGIVANQSQVNLLFKNNIFKGGNITGAWGICAEGIINLTVINNVFINLSSHGVGCRFGTSCTIKNNIIYYAPGEYWSDSNSTMTDRGSNLIFPKSPYHVYSPLDIINMSPLFLDPNNLVGDDGIAFTNDDGYTLMRGSPAIDNGSDTSAYGVYSDIFGTLRPIGLAYDIGAHEYSNGSVAIINGVCGLTNSICNYGILQDVNDSSDNYLWNCLGINGGNKVECSLVKPQREGSGDNSRGSGGSGNNRPASLVNNPAGSVDTGVDASLGQNEEENANGEINEAIQEENINQAFNTQDSKYAKAILYGFLGMVFLAIIVVGWLIVKLLKKTKKEKY